MATIKYLSEDHTKMYTDSSTKSSKKMIRELLWGDRLQILSAPANGRVKVKARGSFGWIDENAIGDESLLEVYFIDVGQGDGILIVTPDRKHIMIDGGYARKYQPHGKSAADFVDWKFAKDYGEDTIKLDVMISSHCDADHYGGLWDLLGTDEEEELDAENIVVDRFYHAGVSFWKDSSHSRFLGDETGGFLHNLLTGKTSVRDGLRSTAPLKLQGYWAQFMKTVLDSGASIERLGHNPEQNFRYLPDFGPGENDATLKILGPVESRVNGKTVLKDLGSISKNTNGNSVLLRLDYENARILLTGDLNKKSQQYIMDSFVGSRQELAADVVKSCHHGSDDCSYSFLESIHASATVISSGDDESHAHPRPNIVAASGATGYKQIEKDEMVTPLIYSTEISRSVRLGEPTSFNLKDLSVNGSLVSVTEEDEKLVKINYTRTTSGALNPEKKTKRLSDLKVVDGIVYGLVNVRTDGKRILCATLNEGKRKWEIKSFDSRF